MPHNLLLFFPCFLIMQVTNNVKQIESIRCQKPMKIEFNFTLCLNITFTFSCNIQNGSYFPLTSRNGSKMLRFVFVLSKQFIAFNISVLIKCPVHNFITSIIVVLLPFLRYIEIYTTFTNFSINIIVMCKVYTDVGGIK